MMDENEIKRGLNEAVQTGMAKVSSISAGQPAYKLTKQGMARAEKIMAGLVGLTPKEFKACSDVSRISLATVALFLVANDEYDAEKVEEAHEKLADDNAFDEDDAKIVELAFTVGYAQAVLKLKQLIADKMAEHRKSKSSQRRKSP